MKALLFQFYIHFTSIVSMMLQQTHVTSILRCVVIIGEDFFKLGVLSSVPPFSLSGILLATREGVRYLICSCFLRKIFCLPRPGSFHLVPFSPFVGCFVLLMIHRFSSRGDS